MDNIKKIILVLGVILLCGCSKIDGAWCSYTETFSSLVITSDDITQEQLNNVVKTISKLENLKSSLRVLQERKKYTKETSVLKDSVDNLNKTLLDIETKINNLNNNIIINEK